MNFTLSVFRANLKKCPFLMIEKRIKLTDIVLSKVMALEKEQNAILTEI